MGRLTHPEQRSKNRPADTGDRQRATRENDAPSFGIWRPLVQGWAVEAIDGVLDAQFNGDIPSEPRLVTCQDLAVTILGQDVIARQLRHRRIKGYDLGAVRARLARSFACEYKRPVVVKRGPIEVLGGKIVHATIYDEQLEREVRGVRQILGGCGLKGLMREGKLREPEITLCEIVEGDALNPDEQSSVAKILEAVVPMEFEVEAWDSQLFESSEIDAVS